MPENPSKVGFKGQVTIPASKIGPTGQVTIPMNFRRNLELSAGDLIQFIDNEYGVLIKKVKIVEAQG